MSTSNSLEIVIRFPYLKLDNVPAAKVGSLSPSVWPCGTIVPAAECAVVLGMISCSPLGVLITVEICRIAEFAIRCWYSWLRNEIGTGAPAVEVSTLRTSTLPSEAIRLSSPSKLTSR